jgi:parallel beta-helix repeat protein
MRKHSTALAIIGILVVSALAPLTSANFMPPPPDTPYGTIYINSDGTITPSTVPIRRTGDVYKFTSSITDYGFDIQCNNIVIDGAGYTLLGGNWYAPQTGIILHERSNVTIQNMVISGFNVGISINNSSNNIIQANKITNAYFGLQIANQSTNNTLSGNNLSNTVYTGHAITISHSVNNKLRNNTIINIDRSNFWSSSNRFNFWLDYDKASSPSEFINDIDTSNTVDGKAICYLVNQHNRTVPPNAGYLALINCSGITAENLNLSNNGQGALLISTTNSYLTGNIITNNQEGIVLVNSFGNKINDNNLTRNVYGVTTYSENNIFCSNRIDNSEKEPYNFGDGYINEVDTSNMVDGSPLCYWVNQHDKAVPSNVGYVFLLNCSRITIQNLTIANKTQGFCLVSTTETLIINNTFADNVYGLCINASSNNRIVRNQITNSTFNSIYLSESQYNTISENQILLGYTGLYVANSSNNLFTKNNITDSSYTGVDFFGASKNILFGNQIINSGRCGIWLEFSKANSIIANRIAGSRHCSVDTYNSQNNVFCHNNFEITIRFNRDIQQSHQVLDIAAGFTASPFTALSVNNWTKNYWSDYNDADVDADGVGNTPYVINSQNQDNYPLMTAYNISNATAPSLEWALPPHVFSTIMGFTEALDSLENTVGEQWNILGYSWTNEFTTEPLVAPDGLVNGHLQYYFTNGSLHEAVYPSGEILGLIQQFSVANGSDSEEYYVWCLELMDGKRVFVDARNGDILYTMLARVPGALLFDVAVKITNASQPKIDLWNVTKYERLGDYSLEAVSTSDGTITGHYLKRTSNGTFYDADFPLGPVPPIVPPKQPILYIQAFNDSDEYNVWEIRTQNYTYYIDARDGSIRYIIANNELPNATPATTSEPSPAPLHSITLPSLSIEAAILIAVTVSIIISITAIVLKRHKQNRS